MERSVAEPWKVEYYRDQRGRAPVKEFIDALGNAKAQVKILRDVQLLREFGPAQGRPRVAKIRDDIWELRSTFSRNQYRILFSPGPGRRLIMLHGFQKKGDRIPGRYIHLAEQRLRQVKGE